MQPTLPATKPQEPTDLQMCGLFAFGSIGLLIMGSGTLAAGVGVMEIAKKYFGWGSDEMNMIRQMSRELTELRVTVLAQEEKIKSLNKMMIQCLNPQSPENKEFASQCIEGWQECIIQLEKHENQGRTPI